MSAAIPPAWLKRIQFRDWAERLAAGPWDAQEKKQLKIVIAWFLKHSKKEKRVASIAEAKRFLDEQIAERQAPAAWVEGWRRGLRWFCSGGMRGVEIGDGRSEVGEEGKSERSLVPRDDIDEGIAAGTAALPEPAAWSQPLRKMDSQRARLAARRVAAATQRQAVNALVRVFAEGLGRNPPIADSDTPHYHSL